MISMERLPQNLQPFGVDYEMEFPEDADMRPPTGVAPFGGLGLLIAKNPSQ
jgi:hypothetical protein